MSSFSVWRKIAFSVPGIFIIETLAAACMLIVLFGPHVRRWGAFALYSAALGALLTLIVAVLNRRTLRTLGLSHTKDLYALKVAVKTNTPPSDTKLLQALPEYLVRQEKLAIKFRKDFKKNLVLYCALLALSASSHILWAVLFAGMIGFSTYYYRNLDSKLENIQRFYVTLENAGTPAGSQVDALRKVDNNRRRQNDGDWVIPS